MKNLITLGLLALASASSSTKQILLGQPELKTLTTNFDEPIPLQQQQQQVKLTRSVVQTQPTKFDNLDSGNQFELLDIVPEVSILPAYDEQLLTNDTPPIAVLPAKIEKTVQIQPIKITVSEPQIKVTTYSNIDGTIKTQPIIDVRDVSVKEDREFEPIRTSDLISEIIVEIVEDDDECEELSDHVVIVDTLPDVHIMPVDIHIDDGWGVDVGAEDEDECEESTNHEPQIIEPVVILPYPNLPVIEDSDECEEDSDPLIQIDPIIEPVIVEPIPVRPMPADSIVLPHPSTPIRHPIIKKPYKPVHQSEDSSSSDDFTIKLKIEFTDSSTSESESHHPHIKSAYLRKN